MLLGWEVRWYVFKQVLIHLQWVDTLYNFLHEGEILKNWVCWFTVVKVDYGINDFIIEQSRIWHLGSVANSSYGHESASISLILHLKFIEKKYARRRTIIVTHTVTGSTTLKELVMLLWKLLPNKMVQEMHNLIKTGFC